MHQGILIDNKIYCPKCHQCNYQLTSKYSLVKIEEIKYTEFVARCLTDGCNEKFYYQSEPSMSGKRFSINREKEIEIRDEFIERN